MLWSPWSKHTYSLYKGKGRKRKKGNDKEKEDVEQEKRSRRKGKKGKTREKQKCLVYFLKSKGRRMYFSLFFLLNTAKTMNIIHKTSIGL